LGFQCARGEDFFFEKPARPCFAIHRSSSSFRQVASQLRQGVLVPNHLHLDQHYIAEKSSPLSHYFAKYQTETLLKMPVSPKVAIGTKIGKVMFGEADYVQLVGYGLVIASLIAFAYIYLFKSKPTAAKSVPKASSPAKGEDNFMFMIPFRSKPLLVPFLYYFDLIIV
jgi:hypothetical protein